MIPDTDYIIPCLLTDTKDIISELLGRFLEVYCDRIKTGSTEKGQWCTGVFLSGKKKVISNYHTSSSTSVSEANSLFYG